MVHQLRSGFQFKALPVKDPLQDKKKLKRSFEAMKVKVKEEANPSSNKKVKSQRVIYDLTGEPVNTKNHSSPKLEKNGMTSGICIQGDGTNQDLHQGGGWQPILPDKADIPVNPEVKEEGGPLKASCCMGAQPARMIDHAIPQIYQSGQSVISGQQKLEEEIKQIPHSLHYSVEHVFNKQQITDPEEANGSTRSNNVKRQRVTHIQAGLPPKTEIASSPELEKGICVLAPTVSCPENGKTSESCIQKDETEQHMHLEIFRSQHVFTNQQINHSEETNVSPENAVVVTNQQLRDSEEATESPSSDISKRISHVEMIYSKRKEKLLANQSKKSLQFKETRNRIEKELKLKLGKAHSDASFLVREMHRDHQARLDGTRKADEEFIKKKELMQTYLDTEQVKLDSIHKADRKNERKLKSHWINEAKSGREVDMYSILPQFLHSCINLDDLNNPSQPLLLNNSTNGNPILPQALKLEWPTAMVTAVQKKKAVGTSFNMVTWSQGPHQDKLQFKVGGELTQCSNVKKESNVHQAGLPAGTEDSSHVKVKLEKSHDPSGKLQNQRTNRLLDRVTAPSFHDRAPVEVICIPQDPPADLIFISDDEN